MPKLAKSVAKRVDKAEVQDFAAFEAGVMVLKLRNVKADKNGEPLVGPAGPYWIWEFEVVAPEKRKAIRVNPKTGTLVDDDPINVKGRRMWVNTSLAESADWKLKEMFSAFGVTPDTDTDEIVGDMIKAQVTVGIQEKGANAGQPQNNVGKVMPYDGSADEGEDDDWDEDDGPDGAEVGETDPDEEPF